jgi:hypothetical protein
MLHPFAKSDDPMTDTNKDTYGCAAHEHMPRFPAGIRPSFVPETSRMHCIAQYDGRTFQNLNDINKSLDAAALATSHRWFKAEGIKSAKLGGGDVG